MKDRRLLERFAYWEAGSKRTSLPQQEVLIESVTQYLRRILNARQGSVLIDPKFGVPDFTNVGSGGLEQGSLNDISTEISRMISRYEPRISDVKVTIVKEESSALALNFNIHCNINLDNQVHAIRLQATVGGNGQVLVK
jgi:type VI secretion system protein